MINSWSLLIYYEKSQPNSSLLPNTITLPNVFAKHLIQHITTALVQQAIQYLQSQLSAKKTDTLTAPLYISEFPYMLDILLRLKPELVVKLVMLILYNTQLKNSLPPEILYEMILAPLLRELIWDSTMYRSGISECSFPPLPQNPKIINAQELHRKRSLIFFRI